MSKWHALSVLKPAFRRMKSLLLQSYNKQTWAPFKWPSITFLAVIAGSSGGVSLTDLDYMPILYREKAHILAASLPKITYSFQNNPTPILAFLASTALAILMFFCMQNIFKFIFLETAISREVQIIKGFRENLWRGVSLSIFTLAIGIFMLILLAPFAPTIMNFLSGDLDYYSGIILISVFVMLSAFVFSLIDDFLVPVMYLRGFGVIGGARFVVSSIRKELWQFAAYLPVRAGFLLVVTLIVTLLGRPGVFTYLDIWTFTLDMYFIRDTILSQQGPLGILYEIPILLMVLFFYLLYTFIVLPLSVTLRYYSLLFLREIDPGLDFEKNDEFSS